MAIQELPPLTQFELHWRSGGHQGKVRTWAPTGRSAVRVVREHPSTFGIPHEAVLIDRCRPVNFKPAGLIPA